MEYVDKKFGQLLANEIVKDIQKEEEKRKKRFVQKAYKLCSFIGEKFYTDLYYVIRELCKAEIVKIARVNFDIRQVDELLLKLNERHIKTYIEIKEVFNEIYINKIYKTLKKNKEIKHFFEHTTLQKFIKDFYNEYNIENQLVNLYCSYKANVIPTLFLKFKY